MYPIVTHWAWDSNGWLYVGVDFTKDNVTMNVAYQVRCLYRAKINLFLAISLGSLIFFLFFVVVVVIGFCR